MTLFDAEYRARVERRLAALRAANDQHGRDALRALRRAAASKRPSTPSRRRVPALTIAALAVSVVVVLYVAERAS